MCKNTSIMSATALVAALVVCLPMGALANEEIREQPEEREAVTPPAGRGPAEAVAPITIAPIAQIRQRGYVQNACEAHAMAMQMVREQGGQRTFGDYQAAYMIDPPKGWYEMRDGQLTWKPPAANETQHIEVTVSDAMTGKALPMSPVTVDVVDQQGNVVQSQQLAYYWHPMADHYGANFSIPSAGNYTLRVRAPAPDIRRHDRTLGSRFAAALDASFTNVQLGPTAPEDSPAASPETSETATPPAGAGPAEPEQGSY